MPNIPWWAKWKAQEANGDWICFESKPYLSTDESIWLNNERWKIYNHGKPNNNWKESVVRI